MSRLLMSLLVDSKVLHGTPSLNWYYSGGGVRVHQHKLFILRGPQTKGEEFLGLFPPHLKVLLCYEGD